MSVVTRKAARLASFLILALPAVAQPWSTGLWRFAYPDSQAILTINWQRIRQTPGAMILRDQWLKTGAAQAVPGIELLDDIDRVVISTPGADESEEPPMLIAVQGRFNATEIARLFEKLDAKPQTYNSFEVYRPQDKDAKDLAYVMFDASTLLFGDATSIFGALDRNRFLPPPPEPGSPIARAAELAEKYDLWLWMKTPDLFFDNALADVLRDGELAAAEGGFDAGLNLHSGLFADVAMHFSSEAAAKRATDELARFVASTAQNKSNKPEVREILRKMKFASDGSLTKISLRLSPEEAQKSEKALARSYSAGRIAAQSAPQRVILQPAARAASIPPQPAKIRIEGLDGGTIEIPYGNPH